MEGAGQQKTLAPSQTLKGREFYFYSRGATLIAFPFFQSHARSQRWRRLILPLCSRSGKATFYWLLCCVGTTHLFVLRGSVLIDCTCKHNSRCLKSQPVFLNPAAMPLMVNRTAYVRRARSRSWSLAACCSASSNAIGPPRERRRRSSAT